MDLFNSVLDIKAPSRKDRGFCIFTKLPASDIIPASVFKTVMANTSSLPESAVV
jgi:hypothetical protein